MVLPPDLPPATFPKTYYTTTSCDQHEPKALPASHRMRLFRFWRSEFASTGRESDDLPQGR